VTTPDVVIVGGGIGGGALAKNLAEAGVTVLVLERTLQYVDVVRGEWIAPWGVPETKAVGVYPIYLANGGHHVTRHVSYDEDVAPRVAEKAAFDLTTLTARQSRSVVHRPPVDVQPAEPGSERLQARPH
jgi:choline dehydrogenase-like flavoprotein